MSPESWHIMVNSGLYSSINSFWIINTTLQQSYKNQTYNVFKEGQKITEKGIILEFVRKAKKLFS